MHNVEKFAGANCYSRLLLSVHPGNNQAIEFYEKLG
ncbi:MAG: GNAT family N-acetyltransferase [Anaerolineaceae bacterium]|nr:GNAT family N-acetyltransferase [Anaerolineaceae bacterium]